MADGMSETNVQARPDAAVEAVLRDELTHGDAVIGTIAPILRHLLANDDHSLFSDEIIARLRGMSAHVATQLLDALDDAGAGFATRDYAADLVQPLQQRLAEQAAFLAHLHALAVEWQLTERLQARLAIDPALSPLLQSLIASTDAGQASGGMALLAAQVRFAQAQRRMQVALGELPPELFHLALEALRTVDAPAEAIERAVATLRANYDEGRSRIGLMTRLVMGLGGGASAALSISHAGVGLFLTALALGAGIDRDLAALSTNETQLARLALALRAAGARIEMVEEQFLAIHPDIALPEGFEQLGADRAAALLARAVAAGG